MNKQTKNLLIFFAVTFVWTWAFYAIIAAGEHNPYEMPWMNRNRQNAFQLDGKQTNTKKLTL